MPRRRIDVDGRYRRFRTGRFRLPRQSSCTCNKKEDGDCECLPIRCARFHAADSKPEEPKTIANERGGLWKRQALQFRRKLIGLIELVLSLRSLTFLAKGQGEIVVRFGVAWLKPRRFCKLRLCSVDIA